MTELSKIEKFARKIETKHCIDTEDMKLFCEAAYMLRGLEILVKNDDEWNEILLRQRDEARKIADESHKALETVLEVVGEEDCWHEPVSFDENPLVEKARKSYEQRSWK